MAVKRRKKTGSTKRRANPKGKVIRGAHVRMLANGRLNVVLPRSLKKKAKRKKK